MLVRLVLVVAVAVPLVLPASTELAAGFCSAQRSLLPGSLDTLALGRQLSCDISDRWLSEHEHADLPDVLYKFGYGNNTSLTAWLQVAGVSNITGAGPSPSAPLSATPSSLPPLGVTGSSQRKPAGWRWDWWVSNMTAAERRFQSRVSGALVMPLVKFSARLGGDVPPAALLALLRHLRKDTRPALLAALREVSGSGGPERLLQRDGSVVRILASAVIELVVLTSGAAQQMQWAAAPFLQKANVSSVANVSMPDDTSSIDSSSASPIVPDSSHDPEPSPDSADASDSPSSSDSSATSQERRRSLLSPQSELLGRALRSLGTVAPFALGAAAALTLVPLTVLSLHLLLGVPVAVLAAVSLYAALLLAGSLARGLVGGEDPAPEAGLLLSRAVEAVLGGFFRMRLLRTLLMFALEALAG